MHYVYILYCADNTFYVGITWNIKKRIIEHRNGLVFSTKYKLPIKVRWVGIFSTKERAAKFEKYLKTGSGNAFFKKRLI